MLSGMLRQNSSKTAGMCSASGSLGRLAESDFLRPSEQVDAEGRQRSRKPSNHDHNMMSNICFRCESLDLTYFSILVLFVGADVIKFET